MHWTKGFIWIISIISQTSEVSPIIIFPFTDEESESEPGFMPWMADTSLPNPHDKTFPPARLIQPHYIFA